MTIETTLQVRLGKESYTLIVKMIRIEGVNYFFIRDIEMEGGLLGDSILELTYQGSFSLTAFRGIVKSPGIPTETVTAIEEELLKNKERWFH